MVRRRLDRSHPADAGPPGGVFMSGSPRATRWTRRCTMDAFHDPSNRPPARFAEAALHLTEALPMTETLDRVKTHQQFIGGSWVDSASGETLAVENPADGTVIAHVQASGAADVDRAVEAAATAFQTWQHTT